MHPFLPVVVATGAGSEEIRTLFAGQEKIAFVTKPYREVELLSALSRSVSPQKPSGNDIQGLPRLYPGSQTMKLSASLRSDRWKASGIQLDYKFVLEIIY